VPPLNARDERQASGHDRTRRWGQFKTSQWGQFRPSFSEVITGRYQTQEEAEAALLKITDARQGKTDVDLPWLQMPGDQVQAAYVEKRTLPGIA
jgi:hypothetical protein